MKAKRIMSLLLILIMLVSMLPTAYAAETGTEPTETAGTESTVPNDTESTESTPTEPTETEAAPEAAEAADAWLEELGLTGDELIRSYVGIDKPEDDGISAFSTTIYGRLKNCNQMDFKQNDGIRQGWHFVDEDGGEPWDYMNMLYCLQAGNSFSPGSGKEGTTDLPIDGEAATHGEYVWYDWLTTDQRIAIGLIIMYGAPTKLWDEEWGINAEGDWNLHNPNIGYRYATQALIWEICGKMREATYPYERTNTHWYQSAIGCCMSEDGTVDHFLVAYDSIVNDLMTHNTIPGFTGDFAATAPEILMPGNSLTLTDTNSVLHKFDFTNTENLSYSKNGNDLTITASGAVPTDVQCATATLPDARASLYEIWYDQYDYSKQALVRIAVPASDPVPAYFKLTTATGALKLVKNTEDGLNKGGWQFGIYSDADCTNIISGPHTSDAEGNIAVSELAAGTVYVKELGHEDPAINAKYHCTGTNPQKVTLTGGEIAGITFQNNLVLGSAKIIKQSTNGGRVNDWPFVLKDATGNVIGTYVTDSQGIIALDLEPGTYIIEEGIADFAGSYWVCDTTPQTVTVKAGETASVTFTNQWLGKAKIIKTMEGGGSPEGWVFKISDADGKEIEGSPFTSAADGTILIGKLQPGNYIVEEIIPEGSAYYCTSRNPQTVTVAAGQTAAVSFVNALLPGRIELQKVSHEGSTLAGAVFLLEWSLDGSAWENVTFTDSLYPIIGGCTTEGLQDGRLTVDADGAIRFTGLHPDLYYRLTEVKAPDGYRLLADAAFEGKLPVDQALEIQLKVVNVPVFKLPETGSKSLWLMPVSLLLCLGTAAFLLCYRRKK